jgi:hypothetical protein
MPMDATPAAEALDASVLSGCVDRLAGLDVSGLSEGDCIELMTESERVKGALAAAQARLTARVAEVVRERHAAAGVPAAQQGRGVAHQIALARRDSPHKGGRHLGLGTALVHEMPRTLAALGNGEISEWRATIMVRETALLSAEDRTEVDRRIGDRIKDWGDAQVAREARKLAQRLDVGAAVKRARKAEADRHVSIRPAPDCMTYVTGLLPVAQGVAVYAALLREADARRAAGDERGKGQIMADTLVERVTGQASAPDVPVEVDLVITDTTLFGDDPTPAHLAGYGPIPAGVARDLVRDTRAAVWLRRLYTSPADGALITMESRRRCFDGQLRRLLVLRDQFCRTTWCDAPIRHADHPVPAADGGPTSALNGAGLCVACNHAKQAPGWAAVPDSRAGPHTLTITTPTGHGYRSRAPDLPGTADPRDAWIEASPGHWVLAA